MRSRPFSGFLIALALAAPAAAQQEDASPGGPAFKEGDIITLDKIDSLKPYLPAEFWTNREFFFYEGMQLEIGPFYRSYAPPPEYQAATERFKGQPQIGPQNSLENYTAGQPFPMDEIDCLTDPQAGAKIIWNFDYQWSGTGGGSEYYYSYWDRGEQLPLFYEGTARSVVLSHRVEKEYLGKRGGDLFRNEKRKMAFGIEINQPFDARGISLMTYRYKSSDQPVEEAKNDDTWIYLPTLRRVRRISTAQRTDAISGTDFTFDDLRSFSGIIPQYEWECLGEMDLIAPMNSKVRAFPYDKDHNFGPFGLSYADDNWEMRKAVKLRFTPKNPAHPYHHKDIWLDKETLTPMYSAAYDSKNELWKVIWHNHRFSEDDPKWYLGWPGVPKPNDLRVVSDTIVNIQTGTGNRIDFWDAHGTPLRSKGRVRRYIDVGRLSKGR
jgi:hypothetical protein